MTSVATDGAAFISSFRGGRVAYVHHAPGIHGAIRMTATLQLLDYFGIQAKVSTLADAHLEPGATTLIDVGPILPSCNSPAVDRIVELAGLDPGLVILPATPSSSSSPLIERLEPNARLLCPDGASCEQLRRQTDATIEEVHDLAWSLDVHRAAWPRYRAAVGENLWPLRPRVLGQSLVATIATTRVMRLAGCFQGGEQSMVHVSDHLGRDRSKRSRTVGAITNLASDPTITPAQAELATGLLVRVLGSFPAIETDDPGLALVGRLLGKSVVCARYGIRLPDSVSRLGFGLGGAGSPTDDGGWLDLSEGTQTAAPSAGTIR